MRKKLSSAALFGIALVAVTAAAVVEHLAARVREPWDLLVTLAGLVLVLIAFAAAYLHWKRLDEAAREAHKAAWYWGGSGGLGLGGLLIGFLLAQPGRDLTAYALAPGDGGMFATGAMAVVGAQFVGYVVVWAWWWWSRR